jgi:hypothetical protein
MTQDIFEKRLQNKRFPSDKMRRKSVFVIPEIG